MDSFDLNLDLLAKETIELSEQLSFSQFERSVDPFDIANQSEIIPGEINESTWQPMNINEKSTDN